MTEEEKSLKQREKNKRVRNRIVLWLSGIIGVLVIGYCVAVFSQIPFIVKWRTLYIETAMSTTSHQWLATAFIPHSIIDEVMLQREFDIQKQQSIDSGWELSEEEQTKRDELLTSQIEKQNNAKLIEQKIEDFYELYWELDSPSVRSYLQTHTHLRDGDTGNILVEDLDEELGLKTVNGDSVLVIDSANHLILIGLHTMEYHGKLAIVKDESQVVMSKSDYLGSRGEIIDAFGEKEDAILAINASGFRDVGGHGGGGQVRGSMIVDGVEYGDHATANSYWRFVGMKYDGRLYITNYDPSQVKDYKWSVEFFPALIIDGEQLVDDSGGWGIQPRTSIGQQSDGSVMMLVIDGRQPGYSIGATVGECARVLKSYRAYQAAAFDGGSSSIMWYRGKQITKSSSPSGFGRYLPNALVVKRAQRTYSR